MHFVALDKAYHAQIKAGRGQNCQFRHKTMGSLLKNQQFGMLLLGGHNRTKKHQN